MAIAMPPSDMMLALMPCTRMTRKATSTPTGSDRMATSDERRCMRNSAQTTATTMNSSTSFSSSVAMARSIRPARS